MAALNLPLRLYRVATRLASLAAPALLRNRIGKDKEDRLRHAEKLGRGMAPRPAADIVWLHCASVGELNTAMTLIRPMIEMGQNVLVTTVTLSSARLAAQRLPQGAIHQFAPLDFPHVLKLFLDHWRPGTAIIVESELWPNTILELSRRKIPAFIVNGRMSDRSERRWNQLRAVIRPVLASFTAILCQTEEDATRYRRLGGSTVSVTGNLKFDAPAPLINRDDLQDLRSRIGDRPVFLAASVHPGEQDAILDAHLACLPDFPRLLTIIAPRHPDKAETFAKAAQSRNLSVATRSAAGETPPLASASVHLVSTLGELGLLYSVAHVAMIGGSLIEHGGQNPIEPAKLEVPILFGPHIGNFREIYAMLLAAGAAIPVANAEALGPAVLRVLSDPLLSIALQREAARLVRENAGALERTLAILAPFLKRKGAVA